MQPRDTRYLLLDDGRKLCLECLDSAIMDTHECQPLYLEIQEFYEGLNMKVEQQIPMLLVERQALNEAMEGEKNVSHYALNSNMLRSIALFSFDKRFKTALNVSRVITTCQKPEDFVYQKNRLWPL